MVLLEFSAVLIGILTLETAFLLWKGMRLVFGEWNPFF